MLKIYGSSNFIQYTFDISSLMLVFNLFLSCFLSFCFFIFLYITVLSNFIVDIAWKITWKVNRAIRMSYKAKIMLNIKKCTSESKSSNANKNYTVNQLKCHQCVLSSFSVNHASRLWYFSENVRWENFCYFKTLLQYNYLIKFFSENINLLLTKIISKCCSSCSLLTATKIKGKISAVSKFTNKICFFIIL